MTMTETGAEPERNSAETAEMDGVMVYFRGGRGTGYTLEWNSPAGVSRVSSRKKKNIFRVFNAFRKKGGKPAKPE